jgi:hypothetical protein
MTTGPLELNWLPSHVLGDFQMHLHGLGLASRDQKALEQFVVAIKNVIFVFPFGLLQAHVYCNPCVLRPAFSSVVLKVIQFFLSNGIGITVVSCGLTKQTFVSPTSKIKIMNIMTCERNN